MPHTLTPSAPVSSRRAQPSGGRPAASTCCLLCLLGTLFGLFDVRLCQAQSLLRGVSSLSATLESADFSLTTQTRRGPVSTDKMFTVSFPIGPQQSLGFSTGYVRATPFPERAANGAGGLQTRTAWRFKAVPVMVSYARTFGNPNARWVPVASVGFAYLFSSLRAARLAQLGGDGYAPIEQALVPTQSASFTERLGVGYGAEASIGLRANIDQNVFLLIQQRLCYVNSLAFTPSSAQGLSTSFTRLDFSVGLGFSF
ncbi:MAG: hypothetical protein AAGI71_09195 [Bacteroidota bacterium]